MCKIKFLRYLGGSSEVPRRSRRSSEVLGGPRRFLGCSSEVLGGSSEVPRRFLGGPQRFLGGSSEVIVHLKSSDFSRRASEVLTLRIYNISEIDQNRRKTIDWMLVCSKTVEICEQRVTYANQINQRQQCFSGTTTRQYISLRSRGRGKQNEHSCKGPQHNAEPVLANPSLSARAHLPTMLQPSTCTLKCIISMITSHT